MMQVEGEIAATIARTLRRKLTLDGEEPLLETVIGRGYRLRGDG